MADDRLLPALLDRLSGLPRDPAAGAGYTAMSSEELRRSVLRDLAWLLNTENLASVQPLDDYPEVAGSVINFGILSLTGRVSASVSLHEVERALRQALLDFEPRIIPDSLRVRAQTDPEAKERHILAFEIEGQLWSRPLPLQLYLRTEFDLVAGKAVVRDAFGREVG